MNRGTKFSIAAVAAIWLIGGLCAGYSVSCTSTSVPAATATPTAIPPTATPTPVPTATPVPNKAQAKYVDPRELVADPQSFVGSNIMLQGRALTVSHYDLYSWVQLMAGVRGKSTTESIVVEFWPKEPRVLSDECYRVYGVVQGTQRVTRTMTGATNEVPEVRGYAWEKAPAGAYGIGCAAP